MKAPSLYQFLCKLDGFCRKIIGCLCFFRQVSILAEKVALCNSYLFGTILSIHPGHTWHPKNLRHQQKPKWLILGSERRRARQSLPIGGERAHSSVIIFHSSIIAQSAREPIAIAAGAGGSRGRLYRSFSSPPLPRVVRVGTLVEGWVGRATRSGHIGTLGVFGCSPVAHTRIISIEYIDDAKLYGRIQR